MFEPPKVGRRGKKVGEKMSEKKENNKMENLSHDIIMLNKLDGITMPILKG